MAQICENPSFYFYKDKAYGKDIELFELQNNYETLFSIDNAQTFELTTTYPGLLVGSGYNHPKLKENNDDFQLGFFFDHTTGLPIISGSSIKGVLRSVFKHKEFMKDIYSKELDESIFEDNKTIFYDAFIVRTEHQDKKIFGSDYITAHFSDEVDGAFKSPNPIKFLKVLPEVTFRFQFSCDDEYRELFKSILLDFGVGAKSNVGYGKFEYCPSKEEQEQLEQEEAQKIQIEKEQKERSEAEAKERAEAERIAKVEEARKEKEQKKQEGLNALLDCKTLADGFKLLKESFGKKPKPTNEEKEMIQKYFKKQKKLSRSDLNVFKKYGVS